MAKIIQITEQQYSKLKQKMLLENTNEDFNDFRVEVDLEFELTSKELDGRTIYGIETTNKNINGGFPHDKITVLFDMRLELGVDGIRDVIITNVRGEKMVDVEIEFEPLDDEDEDYYYNHKISLDWSMAEVIYEEGDGAIPKSIERVIIVLDESLFVEKILIYPFFN
jgi:hypothetical protein